MSRNGKAGPEFVEGAVAIEELGLSVDAVEQLGFRVVENWACKPAVSQRDAYAISKRQMVISEQREDERRRWQAEQDRKAAEWAAKFPVPRGIPAVEGMSAVEQMLAAGADEREPTVFEQLLDGELAHGKGA
jgi:hypothetical protein